MILKTIKKEWAIEGGDGKFLGTIVQEGSTRPVIVTDLGFLDRQMTKAERKAVEYNIDRWLT